MCELTDLQVLLSQHVDTIRIVTARCCRIALRDALGHRRLVVSAVALQ